ncbi:hypothetical protein Tco_1091093 [Tanacetum coccineum]|uniref:Reverse transcriptase domain-containing protein n=1 Tax=Tanacetum coccineum TaxID=301880 RepID=A0ABQ5I693_9ASTR
MSHSTPAVPQNAYQALAIQQPQAEFLQLDSRLVVLSFLPGDDLIASLNKAMEFISTSIASRYPTTNHQLRTSSNLRNQATIQDGRVMIQQVQGIQNHSFAGTRSESNATNTGMHKNRGNNEAIQTRNSEWFNEKLMLVHAHESGQVLDKEQLAFLAYPGVAEGQVTQITMPYNATFQTDDLDAFDSDCDEAPGAKAVLMANLSNYDSDVISEVPITDTHQDIYVLGHCVQEMYYSKQPAFNPTLDIEITSDSNIISYDQYLKETESVVVQNTTLTKQKNAMLMSVVDEITNQVALFKAVNLEHKTVNERLTAELERYKERIKQFEDKQNVDLNDREKYIDSQINDTIHNRNAKYDAFEKEIEILKSNLIKNLKENESLTTAINVLKKETKPKEEKHIKEIVDLEKKKKALDNIVYKVGQSVQTMHMFTKLQVFYDNSHKQALGYQNPFYLKKAPRIKPTLYDGSVITEKHDVIYVDDSEEALILAKESRLKMLEKQNDPISKEKKVNICPINYAELNKLSKHFGKNFVPQKELFTEQAVWLPISNIISKQLIVQPTPVKTEVPHELPKVGPHGIGALSVQDEVFQGRSLDSFQDEGMYEHVRLKDPRLQDGTSSKKHYINSQDKKDKESRLRARLKTLLECKEFLTELQNIEYHKTIDEDVVDHIAKVLEILDLIKVLGVDSYQLRMKVFPLSLADDAREWWINEGEGKITTWEELVEKFFYKFYPESYDGEEEMLDEGDNWGIYPL